MVPSVIWEIFHVFLKMFKLKMLLPIFWKCFGTVPKKSIRGRATFLETLHVTKNLQSVPCILRKWLILEEHFCRRIQIYAFFV